MIRSGPAAGAIEAPMEARIRESIIWGSQRRQIGWRDEAVIGRSWGSTGSQVTQTDLDRCLHVFGVGLGGDNRYRPAFTGLPQIVIGAPDHHHGVGDLAAGPSIEHTVNDR